MASGKECPTGTGARCLHAAGQKAEHVFLINPAGRPEQGLSAPFRQVPETEYFGGCGVLSSCRLSLMPLKVTLVWPFFVYAFFLPAGTPAEMAERLMDQVKIYGEAADDMTILAAGVWKR